ncbi:hypothetical protein ACJU26_09680 [Acidithiobacillus sp. M4-SHS-6]|uniref:hypothetical protein n=1 Tax=Acidithiobacillus sp. M4-SHS-6 TaxID=3383024 RepID=UPI0039BDFABA
MKNHLKDTAVTEKLPWWFWLDKTLIVQGYRIVTFMGGVAGVVLLSFFGGYVTVVGLRDALFCWGIVFLWFPVPFSVWLSRLDWTHRNREVLLAWAGSRSP